MTERQRDRERERERERESVRERERERGRSVNVFKINSFPKHVGFVTIQIVAIVNV